MIPFDKRNMKMDWKIFFIGCFYLASKTTMSLDSMSLILSYKNGLSTLDSDGKLKALGNKVITENFEKCNEDIYSSDVKRQVIYKGNAFNNNTEIFVYSIYNASWIKDFAVDCESGLVYVLNDKQRTVELFKLAAEVNQTVINNVDADRLYVYHGRIFMLYLAYIEVYNLKDNTRQKLYVSSKHRLTALAFSGETLYVAEDDYGILKCPPNSPSCEPFIKYSGFIPNICSSDNILAYTDISHQCVVKVDLNSKQIVSNISVPGVIDVHLSSSSAKRITFWCSSLLIPLLSMFYNIY